MCVCVYCVILADKHFPAQPNQRKHQLHGTYPSDDETRETLLASHSQRIHRTNDSELMPLSSTHHEHKSPASNLIDINAMSVASIYDQENNDIMDADK